MSRYPKVPAPGVLLAILSAILFGASTPLAKLVLGNGVNPWLLASLLYLGSGIGLAIVHTARRRFGRGEAEAPLVRADLSWLALVILCGGGVAPVLLMAWRRSPSPGWSSEKMSIGAC